MTQRWTRRPEGANWGDFGPNDELGSLNHITPESVKRGIAEVQDGVSFCLSLPLDYPGGRALAAHRGPPELHAVERKGEPYFNYSFRSEGHFCDVGSDDYVTLWTQYSTQWDGFAHIGAEFDLDGTGEAKRCYYGGFVAGRDIVPPEQRRDDPSMPLGIDCFAVKCIQTRGVMIDLAHHIGRGKQTIGFDVLEDVMRRDRVTVEPGDVVCLHTGYADEVLRMGGRPSAEQLHGICAALNGADPQTQAWLSDTGIAALVADNYAVERIEPGAAQGPHFLPLHHHCLFKRGIPLGELWYLTELAAFLRANRRGAFLLTAPPLRLRGAVGSPVTPVATV